MQSSPFIYIQNRQRPLKDVSNIFYTYYIFTIRFSKKHINFPNTFSNAARKRLLSYRKKPFLCYELVILFANLEV